MIDLPAISHQIWDMKYRLKEADGTPIDLTIEDSWRRVAKALAEVEPEDVRQDWEDKFYAALEDFKFLPAGRITAGAGTGRKVTLFNCFVMGTVPDSMEGIFEMLKEAALTMQQGGGIGYDFSTIRPKGALVKGVAADASGPLTFMDCWDSMCRTVMSAGERRGAMMATMSCEHPDIEAFIEAKRDPLRLRMFNMSVLIKDSFIEAVKNDAQWRLHFEDRHGETLVERFVSARELWEKIMRSTYGYAEPGVIFIDRINKANNLWYVETIASTNPCGEQPLPPYGACLLGSINIPSLVENAFTGKARINKHKLNNLVSIAVRMMDNVIDLSRFPLQQQEDEAKAKRRIGLGVTGLADAIIMLRMVYGASDAVTFTDKLMRIIDESAYLASVELAKEKGAFPLFEVEPYLASGTHASTLSAETQAEIRKYGIRNALLTSIAPTGTISIYAGNVSSGIEPVFAYAYERKVLQKDGSRSVEQVEDYAVSAFRHAVSTGKIPCPESMSDGWDVTKLPGYFVTAQTLSPMAHVRMQAAAQKWVDSSISKTINLPEDISFEDFCEVYMTAYELGCKGCTTYRPNDVTGSVLSVTEAPKAIIVDGELSPETIGELRKVIDDAPRGLIMPASAPLVLTEPVQRPDALEGATYKIKWPGNEHAIYVTISDIMENGRRRPFEIFINSKNMEHYAWTVALTRMISAVFRRPHDSRFVAEELKAVFDPKGGAWVGGKYVPSVLASIGGVIEQHMKAIGYIEPLSPKLEAMVEKTEKLQEVIARQNGTLCPKCSSSNVKNESGCFQCIDCGESKCG